MLGAQGDEGGALWRGGGRVRRASPVDEEGHEALRDEDVRIGELPVERDPVRAPAASGLDGAEPDTRLLCPMDERFEPIRLDGPRRQSRRRPPLRAQPQRPRRQRLVGIPRQDLEVTVGPEPDQGVPRPLAGVLPPRCGPDPQPVFQLFDGAIEIRHRVHEMVHLPAHRPD